MVQLSLLDHSTYLHCLGKHNSFITINFIRKHTYSFIKKMNCYKSLIYQCEFYFSFARVLPFETVSNVRSSSSTQTSTCSVKSNGSSCMQHQVGNTSQPVNSKERDRQIEKQIMRTLLYHKSDRTILFY